MKTYLISITSNCEGVKENYMDSIDKLEGSVEPIMVAFRPHPPMDMGHFKITPLEENYPNNLRRFEYFPTGFEDDDMIVFTDTSDVKFQCPLPKLDPEIIYLANEYEDWGDNNWWKPYLEQFNCHELDGLSIFNMGTWAMSYKAVKSLLSFIKENKGRFNDWCASDQVLFNLWLLNYPSRIETKPPLSPFACLYNGLEKGKVIIKDGKFFDSFGLLIPVVHANGNQKELLVNKKI